ncbi:hypothetical protein Lal_00018918 [Lupinus albus]|nr:hypothetical protein Lal_00018918 [Lupinus albus]
MRAFQEQGALGLILELEKRLHYGSTCPGKGNGCFHCKEFGHIKRYCPKLDRRPNVMHAGEARDHGRMVTPSGAGTSGVDDPARGKRMVTESGCGKSADRVVAVGDLCKVSDQASGIGPMSAKKVRTLLRKRDRYSFSKCHKRNLYHCVDMRNDVLAGFNPGNGLAGIDYDFGGVYLCQGLGDDFDFREYQSRKPRLIQRFSLERERCIWEGEILGYTGGFSPKREFNTLAQVMKQYFGSSYVAMLWLKLCSNTLAQVMKQYFGSSYVAMLWLKLCSNTLAQVMKQYFGSSYVAMLWLKLCSNTLAQAILHYGSTCPGKGNGCFHCKEFGHIKRYCPKLDRRPNVMHAGEARDHGRMVTPSGAGTSGVDDPARGKRMVTESGCGKSADRVVAVGDLCKVSDQASGIGPMSAKKVRTLLRKRDRYSFSKCHKRNLYHCVDMRNDVLAGFNPGNGLARKLLLFRERQESIMILVEYPCAKGLGDDFDFRGLELEEKREKGAFQKQGALGLILELAKRNTLAQVMKQYFGSSYVAMLWLKLCSNTLAQVMKQYFGSSYVAMLWLKLCSNTLAQVMKQYFGSSYVAMLWLKLCSNTLAQVM